MSCPFCGWEEGMAGSVDPCDVVIAFEDHLTMHVEEMLSSHLT